MKSRNPPAGALRITSYDDLMTYANAFVASNFGAFLLLGPLSLEKVESCTMPPPRQMLSGFLASATPFGIYCAAYEHLNQPIILDDIDGLAADRTGVRLLKSLFQSDPVKRLGWESNATALAQRGIPRQFETSSPVALICNAWANVNADVRAVEDRAHVVLFEPAPAAVHFQAQNWFQDQEIFDFVGRHLHLIEEHSFRTYTLARETKVAGLDWRRTVLSRFLTGPALKVAQLQCDPSCPTTGDKIRAFAAAGFGGRSTYFSYQRRVQPRHNVAQLPLLHPVNPQVDPEPPAGQRSWEPPRRILLQEP